MGQPLGFHSVLWKGGLLSSQYKCGEGNGTVYSASVQTGMVEFIMQMWRGDGEVHRASVERGLVQFTM